MKGGQGKKWESERRNREKLESGRMSCPGVDGFKGERGTFYSIHETEKVVR